MIKSSTTTLWLIAYVSGWNWDLEMLVFEERVRENRSTQEEISWDKGILKYQQQTQPIKGVSRG